MPRCSNRCNTGYGFEQVRTLTRDRWIAGFAQLYTVRWQRPGLQQLPS